MIRRPPRSTRVRSSAASDVYKRQLFHSRLKTYTCTSFTNPTPRSFTSSSRTASTGGWLYTEIKCRLRESNPDTVTHPSTNRAQRRLTSSIYTNDDTTKPRQPRQTAEDRRVCRRSTRFGGVLNAANFLNEELCESIAQFCAVIIRSDMMMTNASIRAYCRKLKNT